ncbi:MULTISPECIES: helix-turn-helix transcriptional regulator [Streptomyces]|uniref:Helix-turn-helix domain-containing protein n=1 Tax=Streptomyces morookaense TaxID=1970 RepID=A0A7Y7B7W3_STRMO|nr:MULTISPECIES: helix-turn-helix transcriptional regulator [Streptomyces]MCC2280358.1 helix-turn-helix transcriptional regulator [Streptomyces sp. ET3-23]NVK80584.1 helix-turn-helix domain-containing protein [Streptomyces morookaense]GHF53930.1 transcriptional regulator [Streptomyces morookaense]
MERADDRITTSGSDRDGSGPVDGIGDDRRALGSFLRARRGRVAPEHVGIEGGRRRRVRGLRREELSQLAGISVDYYVRLEQGRATQPSPEVLDALARALGLDAAERQHLANLAGNRRCPAPTVRVSPLLQRMLDGMDGFPAFATNHRLDVVAWNGLGSELLGGLAGPARRDRNQARFLFLDPASRAVHPEWEARAAEAAGMLRVSAACYPGDAELTGLVTELSARSADFRRIWASGEVVTCAAGRKRLQHPVTGLLALDYETLHVPAAPGETGLVVHVFSAEEGSREAAALARLATEPRP